MSLALGATIQENLDHTHSSGGGVVLLGDAVYTIDTPIKLYDDCSIIGSEKSVIEIAPGANIDAVINDDTTNGNKNITVKGITIKGNYASQSTERSGIKFFACDNVFIENNRIEDYYGFGIYITGQVGGGANQAGFATVKDNYIKHSRHHNITFDSGIGLVEGNYCEETELYDNIQVDGTDGVRVVNNTCVNAKRDNIRVMNYGPGGNRNLIQGNCCDTAGQVNIDITTNSDPNRTTLNKVIGNTCLNSASNGIVIRRSDNCIIQGNSVENAVQHAFLAVGNDNIFTGNQALNNGNRGFIDSGGAQNIYTSNVSQGNGTAYSTGGSINDNNI